MAEYKHPLSQRLRTVKNWLTRAEKAIEEEKDIRAELDLMLAQAELEKIRQVNRQKQGRFRYFILRHGIALCAAVCLAAAGWGGVYLYNGQTDEIQSLSPAFTTMQAQQPAAEERAMPEQAPAVITGVPAAITVKAEPEPVRAPEAKQANVQPEGREAASPVNPAQPVMSTQEMQQLVRAAGKSLRGQ